MGGVDNFVSQNFSEYDSKFDSCLQIVIYGYLLLEKAKTYSRKEIQNIATSVRRKKAESVELEDFLRNDLVTNYIEPHRQLFGLKYYQFHSGAEEFSNNIKTGILDIKVCSPLLNGDTYFIFECKRLNKKLIDSYIKQGVARFIQGQYYPNSNTSVAGMISFLESIDSKDEIKCSTSFKAIGSVLEKFKYEIKLENSLKHHKIKSRDFKEIEEFEYTFVSRHARSYKSIPIDIFHIVLDYNHLIIS
jgi:hypothetical protein